MAENYDLVLDVDVASDDVLSRLADLAGGELRSAELFIMPALWASVSAVDDPASRQVYRDVWSADMRTSVFFGLGYKTDPDSRGKAVEVLSVAAAKLAFALDCGAGLTWEMDRKILRRQEGRLHLYSWWQAWSEPSVLAQLPEPYIVTDETSTT